jgi:hypothetical protein
MNDQTVDSFARRAAGVFSRRASLIGLGGAALVAALLEPAPGRAGKVGKRVKRTCKRQIGQCRSSVETFCARPNLVVPADECEAALSPCCPSFKNCRAGAAYDCIGDALLALVPQP